MIPARNVRSPDQTFKQDVAHESDSGSVAEENPMFRRMAGTMTNVKTHFAECDDVAVEQEAVGDAWLGLGKAGPTRIFAQSL